MQERINSLAREIKSIYESIRVRAEESRLLNPSLAVQLQKVPLNLSVCAVDGGMVYHRMHGADIVGARSVGVNFVYENNHLKSFSHHPSKSPKIAIEIKSSLDEHEAGVFRSLVRLKSELECAIETLEKYSPQVLLMDGSLLPIPADHPGEKSELMESYLEILSLYGKLFTLSQNKNCLLCGVIKDSRAKKLSKELGFKCPDTLLCSYLLKEGESTYVFPYSEEKISEKIKVFYIRPCANDLPLRIEVLDNGTDIHHAASLISSLSAISKSFASPAILIEADMCAAVDSKEIESIENALSNLSGMKSLRRNSRPFR